MIVYLVHQNVHVMKKQNVGSVAILIRSVRFSVPMMGVMLYRKSILVMTVVISNYLICKLSCLHFSVIIVDYILYNEFYNVEQLYLYLYLYFVFLYLFLYSMICHDIYRLPKFDIDRIELEIKFKEAQKLLHPDKFAIKSNVSVREVVYIYCYIICNDMLTVLLVIVPWLMLTPIFCISCHRLRKKLLPVAVPL